MRNKFGEFNQKKFCSYFSIINYLHPLLQSFTFVGISGKDDFVRNRFSNYISPLTGF